MSPPEPPGENTEGAKCTPKRKKTTLGCYFKTIEQDLPSLPINQKLSVTCELQAYLQSHNLDSEGDPLKWWKENEKVYPRLSKVGKKYWCIPATSSPSERAFSIPKNVLC